MKPLQQTASLKASEKDCTEGETVILAARRDALVRRSVLPCRTVAVYSTMHTHTFIDQSCWHYWVADLNLPTFRPLDDPPYQLTHLPSLVSRFNMLSAGSWPDGDGINPEDLKIWHPVCHPRQVSMSWVTDASCTFSLGRRLMVLSGRSTRRTLRDLMVLMSLPFVPLRRWKV